MPACTSASLALNGTNQVPSQDGKAVDWVTQFILRNTSASSCRLNGWPGLEFFGENVIMLCQPTSVPVTSCPTPDHTSPQPIPVTRAPGDPREVVLAPGGLTLFGMLWTIGGDSCMGDVRVIDPWGVHILLPGDTQPLTQLFETNDPQICGPQVQVTAFGAAG